MLGRKKNHKSESQIQQRDPDEYMVVTFRFVLSIFCLARSLFLFFRNHAEQLRLKTSSSDNYIIICISPLYLWLTLFVLILILQSNYVPRLLEGTGTYSSGSRLCICGSFFVLFLLEQLHSKTSRSDWHIFIWISPLYLWLAFLTLQV